MAREGIVTDWFLSHGVIAGDDGDEVRAPSAAISGCGTILRVGRRVQYDIGEKSSLGVVAKGVYGPGVVVPGESFEGVVGRWSGPYGFITGDDGVQIVAPKEALGASCSGLKVGERVTYEREETERGLRAFNIRGPGVAKTNCGRKEGTVTQWAPSGYGFVKDDDGEVGFVRKAVLPPDCVLRVGRRVSYFTDAVGQPGAHGLSGGAPAVRAVEGPGIVKIADLDEDERAAILAATPASRPQKKPKGLQPPVDTSAPFWGKVAPRMGADELVGNMKVGRVLLAEDVKAQSKMVGGVRRLGRTRVTALDWLRADNADSSLVYAREDGDIGIVSASGTQAPQRLHRWKRGWRVSALACSSRADCLLIGTDEKELTSDAGVAAYNMEVGEVDRWYQTAAQTKAVDTVQTTRIAQCDLYNVFLSCTDDGAITAFDPRERAASFDLDTEATYANEYGNVASWWRGSPVFAATKGASCVTFYDVRKVDRQNPRNNLAFHSFPRNALQKNREDLMDIALNPVDMSAALRRIDGSVWYLSDASAVAQQLRPRDPPAGGSSALFAQKRLAFTPTGVLLVPGADGSVSRYDVADKGTMRHMNGAVPHIAAAGEVSVSPLHPIVATACHLIYLWAPPSDGSVPRRRQPEPRDTELAHREFVWHGAGTGYGLVNLERQPDTSAPVQHATLKKSKGKGKGKGKGKVGKGWAPEVQPTWESALPRHAGGIGKGSKGWGKSGQQHHGHHHQHQQQQQQQQQQPPYQSIFGKYPSQPQHGGFTPYQRGGKQGYKGGKWQGSK